MKDYYKDKTALITGGASGIGRQTCISFAKKGTNVIIADLDQEKAEQTVKEIENQVSKAVFVKTDVSDYEQAKNAVQKAKEEFGKLDFAFNNAGIPAAFHETGDYPQDKWNAIININLNGVWNCMKHEINAMKENSGGVIINNASILGKVGFANSSPYVAAKHGVVGLTKTAAIEYATQKIRINAICPGFIETPMLEQAGVTTNEEMNEKIKSLHPMQRLGKPEEIADSVVWLCSDEASFITGEQLLVDGGYTSQ